MTCDSESVTGVSDHNRAGSASGRHGIRLLNEHTPGLSAAAAQPADGRPTVILPSRWQVNDRGIRVRFSTVGP